MFMTELQHCQINSMTAITNAHIFFLHFQSLFVAGQAPGSDHSILVSLVATYENRSCKRPASVRGIEGAVQESLHNVYLLRFPVSGKF